MENTIQSKNHMLQLLKLTQLTILLTKFSHTVDNNLPN